MLRCLRLAGLVTAVPLLAALPIDDVGVVLMLFVAVDLAVAALILGKAKEQLTTAVAVSDDVVSLTLRRRTEPVLRMRRPMATVEAQVAWRQTAERHRRRRELAD